MRSVREEKEKEAIKEYRAWVDYGIQETLKYPVKKTKETQDIWVYKLTSTEVPLKSKAPLEFPTHIITWKHSPSEELS